MDSHQINVKLNQYINLRDNVSNIISSLNNGSDRIDTANLKINEYYLIDDVPADNGKISNVKNNINQVRDILRNSIQPSIEEHINYFRNLLQETVEREEQERAEAAAA